MSAFWDWISSGGTSDTSDWGTSDDSYGDWGDPSTWTLPDTDIIDTVGGWISDFGESAVNAIAKAFTKEDGSIDWRAVVAAGGAALPLLTGGSSSGSRPTGYQGGIPRYSVLRETVPTNVTDRRPGSGGLRYFTDTQYVPTTGDTAAEALTTAQTSAAQQKAGLETLNRQNPYNAPPPVYQPAPVQSSGPPPASPTYNPAYSGENVLSTVRSMLGQKLASGGIVGLQDGGFVVPADVVSHLGNGSSDAGLRYLQKAGAVPIRGRGDGMSDSNPTTIGGQQRAAVAHEEAYFTPEETRKKGGPQALYDMMDQVRKARTGTTKQGKQIDPRKFIPR